MAPTRKSRSVKRVSYVSDVAPNKDGENNKRSGPRKKKLSDMLGPQWSKEELERFYEAYRRYGKDWKKVAVAVRNRSAEMVEALYTMNRAYLSLPEGTASVIGLIAMMTDHYCVLGGTDSEQESNEKSGALQKPLKQNRGKLRAQSSKGLDLPLPYLLQFQSGASKYGCLSLLKKRRSGSRPHAVGKRTPRVPISYTCDKSKSFLSPLSQGLKRKLDAVDDDVAHEVALALTEASQKGGSPQISQTLNRKAETPSPAPTNDRMCAESEITSSKFHTGERDEYGHEISLGSTEADNGDQSRSKNYLMNMRHTGVMEAPSKRRRYNRKKLLGVEDSVDDHLEETKEACSGTEGQTIDLRGSLEVEITDATTSRNSTKGRKRSTKVLFKGGEETSFDALQTLADLSLMMPESAADTESSTQLKEEESQVVQKPRVKGISSIPGVKVTALKSSKGAKCFGPDGSETHQTREKSHQDESGMQKKRQKPSLSKVLKDDINVDSSLGGLPKIELQNRGKLPDDAARLKQAKLRRPLEHTSSSTDLGKEAGDSVAPTSKVPSMNQVILPTRIRSKRKMVKNKLVTEKNFRLANDLLNGKSDVTNSLSHGRSLNIKDKLSNFLSQYQARRWCTCEWFYSAIDYPWFAKREFVEYLDHVGLGHIPRLTRVEWGVIRSSLGKPRRFSDQFLKEEKEKLNQYRESVRTHYAELHAGTREGLPTDLARPLSVGQRVIAIHPKNGEVQNGSVLNIDHSRYWIQFDGPELGVEFVMDIDCMPLNFLESMPASFGRQNSAFSKFVENFNDLKMNVQHKESRIEEHAKLSLYENATSPTRISPSTFPISNMVQHVKIDSSPDLQPKVGPSETAYTQQMLNSQPSTLSQNQARGADIQALSDLTRALDKKEALVSELRSMNDEVMENQRGGHKSLKDSDSFKKQYAAVLLQLNDVNEQVSAALLSLRQRNTYHGSQSHMWLKTMPNSSERGGHLSPFDHSTYQSIESKSNVSEIVESSRVKARGIVDAAVQAMTSVKKEDKSRDTIEEAIDFINNRLSVDDLNVSALRPLVRKDLVDCTLALHDQTVACTSNLAATSDASDFKLDVSDQNGSQVPSDLIAHCVATLLIIQKCTERQFPPGDVAQVLDSAVTNMQPICSQNLPVYAEIQKCMGIIRNQILALVPT